ncbi:MAG: hypothetical protein GXN93_00990 [Candidatus Diapherotrites archaeon]|nr:hypothetical protein [Candidatus Diapherotrites archaeon]
MFGGSIYGAEERRKKIYVAALAILVVAVAIFVWKSIPRTPLAISWDSGSVQPGGEAILRVTVTNNSNVVVKNAVVFVEPISRYLHVYSKQSLDNNGQDPRVFIIPSLAPGDSAVATYLVKVGATAYAGDHSVSVSVALPGTTYQQFAKIRVM